MLGDWRRCWGIARGAGVREKVLGKYKKCWGIGRGDGRVDEMEECSLVDCFMEECPEEECSVDECSVKKCSKSALYFLTKLLSSSQQFSALFNGGNMKLWKKCSALFGTS